VEEKFKLTHCERVIVSRINHRIEPRNWGYFQIAERCGAGWSVNLVARARYITLFMPFEILPILTCAHLNHY
jgi:hypothetical protein